MLIIYIRNTTMRAIRTHTNFGGSCKMSFIQSLQFD